MKFTIHVASLLAVVLGAATSSAQAWTQIATTQSPAARTHTAMAYDAARQRVVLFAGGTGASPVFTGDTWEWNGVAWTQATPSPSPAARYGHTMAYHAAAQQLMIFGGALPGLSAAGDTWTWNGAAWTQSTPPLSPSPRWVHAMAYHAPSQRVVLFGGYDGAARGDTWEWDGTTWTQATPSASPSPRWSHAMAYDAARQRVVLFGGSFQQGLSYPCLGEMREQTLFFA